MIIKNKKAILS